MEPQYMSQSIVKGGWEERGGGGVVLPWPFFRSRPRSSIYNIFLSAHSITRDHISLKPLPLDSTILSPAKNRPM